jgi:hypothetical protein
MIVSGTEASEFINGLVGRPWSARWNCWTLATVVQRRLYGRDLPAGYAPRDLERRRALFAQSPERARWQDAGRPVDGALALMRRVADDEHCGVALDLSPMVVIHVDEPHGVVLDSPAELLLRNWRTRFLVPCLK